MKRFTLTILSVFVSVVGCSVQVSVGEKSEKDLGSHHVVVKPGSAFTSSSSSHGGNTRTDQFVCGDTSVTIRNEELIINNVTYGTLKAGAAVLIDNGRVFVANSERQGTPISEQEVLASAPIKQSTRQLAGHDLTVRPGSPFTSSSQIFGRHTFTCGETKVSIKADELFVNGKSYGKLVLDDTILVENKKVTVSGETRKAKR